MIKVFETFFDTNKDTSENLTKTITETSINSNQTLENINEKLLELMKGKAMINNYLPSSLINLFKLDP